MTSAILTLYIPHIPSIPASFSHLLYTYSNIPLDQHKIHIQGIRDRAYEYHKYPCLGRFRFLDLDISAHTVYQEVVSVFQNSLRDDPEVSGGSKGRNGDISGAPIFLDLGCCLSQDLRKLLLDICSTAPEISLPPPTSLTSRLYGADLLPGFIDAGYALFNDGAIMPRSQFICPTDVLDASQDNALSKLDGKVNVLHAGAFFHLFDWEMQKEVARRCLRLLSRAGLDVRACAQSKEPAEARQRNGDDWNKKALIFGEQVGTVTAGEVARITAGGSRYRHNEESWRRIWEEIVEEEEWKGMVKRVAVENRLEARSMASRARDPKDDGEAKGKAAELEAGSEEERKRFVGRIEEGFRWQIWWVWVTFV